MKEMKVNWPVTVFYDGACPLCSREINHYRGLPHAGKLNFVDISLVDFNPGAYGKSMDLFMARMQVQDASGSFFEGIDGFKLVWAALPGAHYRLLSSFIELPVINGLSRMAYRIFAANRHRLPGRKECNDSRCKID